ncbi:MAG: hypothetical protein CL406_01300 [Acidimicrobiaceae bacterium]|nr:hypothetical protein [Acidimicrobiaceae bacterium]
MRCCVAVAVRCLRAEEPVRRRAAELVRRGENPVPLSDEEERILNEIEEQLYETDPSLVREVSQTTVYTQSIRHLKWSILGFLLGVTIMVAGLSTSFLLSFLGFLVMLASALALERNARHLGRTGMQQAAQSGRGAALRAVVGDSRQRMRERFRRGEERRSGGF